MVTKLPTSVKARTVTLFANKYYHYPRGTAPLGSKFDVLHTRAMVIRVLPTVLPPQRVGLDHFLSLTT